MYKNILVCTIMYHHVLVCTGTYKKAHSCPSVSDSRCIHREPCQNPISGHVYTISVYCDIVPDSDIGHYILRHNIGTYLISGHTRYRDQYRDIPISGSNVPIIWNLDTLDKNLNDHIRIYQYILVYVGICLDILHILDTSDQYTSI